MRPADQEEQAQEALLAFCPSTHGSIVKAARSGANGFAFNGWIGGHRLAPGTYRLTGTPAGGRPQSVTFKVAT
jgi:hypothetical protein